MHNSQQPRSPRLLRVHCHRANVHSGQWCAVTYYQPVARPDCREHCWLRIMCLPVPKPGGSRRMCDKYMNLRYQPPQATTVSQGGRGNVNVSPRMASSAGLAGTRYMVATDLHLIPTAPPTYDPSICSTKCQSGCNFGTDGEPSHLPTRAITALREGGKNMCGAWRGCAGILLIHQRGPPQPAFRNSLPQCKVNRQEG